MGPPQCRKEHDEPGHRVQEGQGLGAAERPQHRLNSQQAQIVNISNINKPLDASTCVVEFIQLISS